MQANFGDILSPFAIEKLALAEGQKAVVGVLSTKIVIVKVHFIPDLGYIHCFGSTCCENHGLPSVRYGLPIVQYETDGKLNIISNELIFDKMIVDGAKGYKNLLQKDEILKMQGKDITKVDLLVTCTDSQYQNKTYDVLGDAKWRLILTKELYKEKMVYFLQNAEATFGRIVDETGYAKLMSAAGERPVVDRPSAAALRPPSPSVAGPALPGKAAPVSKPTPAPVADSPIPPPTIVEVDLGDLDFEALLDQ